MSYKVDAKKGYKALRSISPPIIFVNGMIASGKDDFLQLFKDDSYSIVKFKAVPQLRSYMTNRKGRFDHNPLIIDANVKDENMINDIFSGEFHNFTYVFIYPNQANEFEKKILPIINDFKNGAYKATDYEIFPNNKNDLTSLDFLKLNREIYKAHLEFFDNKILTILT